MIKRIAITTILPIKSEGVFQLSVKRWPDVTRQYMAKGHDGDNALKGCKYSIDDETGKLMSTLYVLGESLREVHVVFFTTCGNICGVFHHKSKSPQVLVVFFATSPNHHKYLW